MTSLEDRLEAVMVERLDLLIDRGHQLRPSLDVVSEWQLPETDLRALVELGLPLDLLMTPSFQGEVDPVLSPNVAGLYEASLIAARDKLYDLGSWGSHDLTPRIGAVAGSGRVLAIQPVPITAADLHPSLREHYDGLYQPAVELINSSVSQFVEISWRWRAARSVLLEFEEFPLPQDDREFDEHLARCQACELSVLKGIERIDPAIRADNPNTLWAEAVVDSG